MTYQRIAFVLLTTLALGACGSDRGDRIASGAGIGAGTGAAVGAIFGGIGAIPGALIGAGLGGFRIANDVHIGIGGQRIGIIIFPGVNLQGQSALPEI